MALKTNRTLFLFLSLLIFFSGCSKSPEDLESLNQNPNVTVGLNEVSAYQLVELKVKQNFESEYKGTFGTASLDLYKSSDSTIAFFVPEVSAGDHILKFELSDVKFKVVETPLVDAAKELETFEFSFDARTAMMVPANTAETEELNAIKKFKKDVFDLFASMTPDQQKQAIALYKNYKSSVPDFASSVFVNLDAPGVYGRQSDCSRTNYKTFYDCTCDNLSVSYMEFKRSTAEVMKYVVMAGTVGGTALTLSALGPVAIGITAVGMSLPVAAAVYLAVTELWPAWVKLRNNTYDIIKAPWIFRDELFNNLKAEFAHGSMTDLNVLAGFRTMNETDGSATPKTGAFISAYTSLKSGWDKLSGLFGNLPSFTQGNKEVTLTASEITIDQISNPYVKLVGQQGESAKFETTSGKEETFTYRIRAEKEGFVEEKTASAKVLAPPSFQLTSYWKLYHYSDGTRTQVGQVDLIDFKSGSGERAWPVSYVGSDGTFHDQSGNTDTRFTWNQSFSASKSQLNLTHNYWNVLYQFDYDPNSPTRLIGQSIGLSNNGYNLELVKQ